MRSSMSSCFVMMLFLIPGSFYAAVSPLPAQDQPATRDQEIQELNSRIEQLRMEAEENKELIEKLKTRLDKLAGKAEEAPGSLSDEIDDFLKLQGSEGETPPEEIVFTSPQRQLNDLNPEISILGDFLGMSTNGSLQEENRYQKSEEETNHEHTEPDDGFEMKEVELSFQAPLDPYSAAKFFISLHQDHVEAEEAYAEWTNLPARMQLKLGKFRSNFGILNRWHPHAYPTYDIPLALENLFGPEGLSGVGASLTFLLPGLWAHYNELNVEVINGDNEVAFSGESFDEPVGVFHLKNFYDVSNATYFELGLSGALGENDPLLDDMTFLEGIDLSLVWLPPQQSKYHSLEFRTEAFFEQRQNPLGRIDTFNMFSYVDFKFSRRWTTGLRMDYVQDQLVKDERTYAIGPFLTFWQSEFVRLRVQYRGLHELEHDWKHRVVLQSTFALGPHKHEKY